MILADLRIRLRERGMQSFKSVMASFHLSPAPERRAAPVRPRTEYLCANIRPVTLLACQALVLGSVATSKNRSVAMDMPARSSAAHDATRVGAEATTIRSSAPVVQD